MDNIIYFYFLYKLYWASARVCLLIKKELPLPFMGYPGSLDT